MFLAVAQGVPHGTSWFSLTSPSFCGSSSTFILQEETETPTYLTHHGYETYDPLLRSTRTEL